MDDQKIKVGISSCLLGQEVRFNGGHKRSRYITDTLSAVFSFLPICPEIGIGLGVPRKPIRLLSVAGQVRAVNSDDEAVDVTEPLKDYADKKSQQHADISGYIFKKGSPSCGVYKVKVYGEKGIPFNDGQGIYAEQFIKSQPLLPVEEEGRLNDAPLRENFVKRVLIYHRWQMMLANTPCGSKELIKFHQQHKFIIMSYSQTAYRALGQTVAALNKKDFANIRDSYITELMQVIKKPASRKNHVNVLQHIQGYLKDNITAKDKAELAETIQLYYDEVVPLIVPITLLKHHFKHYPDAYIEDSFYLNPYPQLLTLMNYI